MRKFRSYFANFSAKLRIFSRKWIKRKLRKLYKILGNTIFEKSVLAATNNFSFFKCLMKRVFFREIFAFIREIFVFLISRNRLKKNFGKEFKHFLRANEMRKNYFRETLRKKPYINILPRLEVLAPKMLKNIDWLIFLFLRSSRNHLAHTFPVKIGF